jgi:hypothetical protein
MEFGGRARSGLSEGIVDGEVAVCVVCLCLDCALEMFFCSPLPSSRITNRQENCTEYA